MPWRPSAPGEVPTLGHYVIDWMTAMLAAPARADYEPFVPYREQEDFLLRWYEIDPVTGRFRYDRGLLGRSRGWGKSPILAGIAAAEALADVLPDGWDADGLPVGRPWSTIRTPLIHIAAVSEEQTKNTWQPLLEMLRGGPVIDEYPGLDVLDGAVMLPRGKIEQVTASARSIKGAPTVFATLDQTEEWTPSVGGARLAQTIRTNVAKNGGRTIESPNAYTPGLKSVAEDSANYARDILEGRSATSGLLFDNREWPADTDVSDRESLTLGLRVAYGDSSAHPGGCLLHEPPCPPGHVELEPLISIIWDPATDIQLACADFGNQVTHAADSFVSSPQWRNCLDDGKTVKPREIVTIGFDGSRAKAKGKPDATALVGCRVSDGHLFQLGVWEAPDMPSKWAAWEPSMVEIEATLTEVFSKYRVAKFYADPAKDWRSHVNSWEAKFAGKLVKPTTAQHPFEWWMTGGRATLVERAVEALYAAIANADITHDGSAGLTRHMLNARRRESHGKLALGKASSYSEKKIDAAVAATLAYQGRLDALSGGVPDDRPQIRAPRRIY